MARNKLRALRNKKRPTFSATFKKYGLRKTYFGKFKQTALLVEVKYKGEIVADHLWFEVNSSFRELKIKKNEIIQFKATISEYLRGYIGTKPINSKRKLELDYCLIYLSEFKKIS